MAVSTLTPNTRLFLPPFMKPESHSIVRYHYHFHALLITNHQSPITNHQAPCRAATNPEAIRLRVSNPPNTIPDFISRRMHSIDRRRRTLLRVRAFRHNPHARTTMLLLPRRQMRFCESFLSYCQCFRVAWPKRIRVTIRIRGVVHGRSRFATRLPWVSFGDSLRCVLSGLLLWRGGSF
jgi:hypothetical protein